MAQQLWWRGGGCCRLPTPWLLRHPLSPPQTHSRSGGDDERRHAHALQQLRPVRRAEEAEEGCPASWGRSSRRWCPLAFSCRRRPTAAPTRPPLSPASSPPLPSPPPLPSKYVDLAAPGTVRAGFHRSDDDYQTLTGTSMACPIVAGAAVLLWSSKPTATPLEVKQALMSSVDKSAKLRDYVGSGGRLNIAQALLELLRVDKKAKRLTCESPSLSLLHVAGSLLVRCRPVSPPIYPACFPPPATLFLHPLQTSTWWSRTRATACR